MAGQFLQKKWGRPLANGQRVINAKVKTVQTKFADAFQHRRCLIPNDGFCKWETKDGKKMPWRFCPSDPDEIWMFAGLYRVIYNIDRRPESDVKQRQFVISPIQQMTR